MRAALVASCFRGAFPPVDLRAVCFVRAILTKSRYSPPPLKTLHLYPPAIVTSQKYTHLSLPHIGPSPTNHTQTKLQPCSHSVFPIILPSSHNITTRKIHQKLKKQPTPLPTSSKHKQTLIKYHFKNNKQYHIHATEMGPPSNARHLAINTTPKMAAPAFTLQH